MMEGLIALLFLPSATLKSASPPCSSQVFIVSCWACVCIWASNLLFFLFGIQRRIKSQTRLSPRAINIKAAHFPAPPLDPLWEISDGAVLLALLFLSQGVLMNQTSSLDRSSPSFSTKPCVIFGCFPLNLFIHTVMCRSFSSFLIIFAVEATWCKRHDAKIIFWHNGIRGTVIGPRLAGTMHMWALLCARTTCALQWLENPNSC